MACSSITLLSFLALPLLVFSQSISTDDGYTGYKLDIREDGDPTAVLYETANTQNNVSDSIPEPDVFLNASLSVGEIYIEVDNLTAQVNLAAQVLQLLDFNAGVDLSINKVELLIQNVSAKVLLEARLTNLVLMINDTLSSIDLNPVIAELGSSLDTIVADTGSLVGDLTSDTVATKRSLDAQQLDLLNNVLYSINDYSGNTHTNRILAQNGDIVEQKLDNSGNIYSQTTVGNFLQDMTFSGFNKTATFHGQEVQEEEYLYEPFMGLMAICGIFFEKGTNTVVGTQLLSTARGGGTSTIEGELVS